MGGRGRADASIGAWNGLAEEMPRGVVPLSAVLCKSARLRAASRRALSFAGIGMNGEIAILLVPGMDVLEEDDGVALESTLR